jgi:hypothetical protein
MQGNRLPPLHHRLRAAEHPLAKRWAIPHQPVMQRIGTLTPRLVESAPPTMLCPVGSPLLIAGGRAFAEGGGKACCPIRRDRHHPSKDGKLRRDHGLFVSQKRRGVSLTVSWAQLVCHAQGMMANRVRKSPFGKIRLRRLGILVTKHRTDVELLRRRK